MKLFKKSVLSTVLGGYALSIAGCASDPSSIQAQYVSEIQYNSLSCQQIGEESARLNARVAEVTGQQQEAATTDAVSMGVGLVLFWPALFMLAGTDDKENELARLKGEAEALHRASLKKNCGFTTEASAKK
ncbi:hypothetical protein [Terasakiella sp. SH-1]|uniref:hypothetical protein n=1 Tax=Terasakiella sp. SH-1 TaxID=2560057 RepID=UPI0010740461|nr:hypothetical protein [Terasakiella sp. SH-1]